MMKRLLPVLVAAVTSPLMAWDDFRDGRIRYVEQGVTLQRAAEAGAEEALPNLPFLPGDRIWTDDAGRVEFQFADGNVVRLDSRSKLDYIAHDEGRGGERIVLRLWSGGLYLRSRDDRARVDFEIETPGGVVEARERVVYRIDTDSGETRLSVYEGQAALESGRRRVTVEAGQRTYARRGEAPEAPRFFDRAELDDFSRWEADREQREVWAGTSERYLPEHVQPYASDFESYGSWYYQSEVGHVWRPYVAAGWRPYWYGHWTWTPYGWTWVPNEPWGWAPFHYGRWDYAAPLGWYWIPGHTWGPAWVSWAVAGDYVGWCPLGYRDRPVIVREDRFRGRAVPRGSVPTTTASGAWVYAHQSDLGGRDFARRRLDSPVAAHDIRVIESPRARLGRDLRVVEGETAVPRNVMTKPTPGDTVPELRTDPTTTIPFPTARRRSREEREDVRSEPEKAGAEEPARPATRPRAPEPASPVRDGARPRWPERAGPDRIFAAPQPITPAPEGTHPAPEQSTPEQSSTPENATPTPERPRPLHQVPRPTDMRSPGRPTDLPVASTPEAEVREDEPRAQPQADPDREVLRRFFRPLGESRTREASDEERAGSSGRSGFARRRGEREGDGSRPQPEAQAPPRNEHPPEAPPPHVHGAEPAPDGARAVRRPRKEKEQEPQEPQQEP